jgi:hypothetical protein
MKIIKGFKGFDKDLKCRNFQFEIGKEYTHKGEIEMCSKGFHFCDMPLDVFTYYAPGTSNYATVETDGETERKGDGDSKIVTNELKITAEIGIIGLLKAGIEWIFNKVKASPDTQATTGNYAHSATTGYSAHSATAGYSAHSATTGDSARSATTGENCISASLGKNGTVKAAKGSWIVLAEYDDNYKIICVKSVKVDGKKIKADTWYKLENKEIVAA